MKMVEKPHGGFHRRAAGDAAVDESCNLELLAKCRGLCDYCRPRLPVTSGMVRGTAAAGIRQRLLKTRLPPAGVHGDHTGVPVYPGGCTLIRLWNAFLLLAPSESRSIHA